jgi:hypothetical protein
MRLILGAFILAALIGTSNFFAAPVSAQSAEQCRAEFIALYTRDQGYIYPYQIEGEETMAGYTTSGTTTVISPTHQILDDGWGNLSEYNGRNVAESTNNGTSWTLVRQLDANHWLTTEQYGRAAAQTATDVSCSDNVRFDGGTYRRVQGTTNHGGSELTETYYRNSAGIVEVREVSGSLVGTDFSSMDRTVAVGNDVVIPQNYR